jgi:hypothetical protein
VHNGVSISESALVLGAWKFQQGKFCNCGKSGLGFGGDFLFLSQAKEGIFPSQERHTCEVTCERREEKQHTCVRKKVQAAHVRSRYIQPLHVRRNSRTTRVRDIQPHM